MEGHLRTVASLHIALSILGFLLAIVLYSILSLIGNFVEDQNAEFILTIIANVLAIFLFILAIPGLIGGIGLLKYKEWARILILIVSALKLLSFPIGTAIGVYSIWVLVQKETTDLFAITNGQNQNQ
ncbi:MAG: hypothetical protein A2W90_15630 [Bacteroidetes bacterium GWF2_42_66]|nr:MAG: hypothetical protein A2W92_08160 [Bacteroidetes bacterium GWA2_42_15]OFY02689.1 MAG: hypothetical protein A2W89_04215 [Bacteroidetes bacterium GWE2_42_39]OFY43888.1 MAG: hypothetical protein A2W90_15630 [Bacteroidetes bacterium GWF2_42_66]HBL77258.1 hypothetical protein [Prolixibacteraceae bacterium]HCR90634.1 hypothetical protein [Prolixibacteraceae bacterium]